jgi:hypothetical protein
MFQGWGIAEETPEIARLVERLRANERRLRLGCSALEPDVTASVLWRMVAENVLEARPWRVDGMASLDGLCERALRLRGGPDGARERRMMREKAHVLQRHLSPRQTLPSAPDDLLGLWDEATRLEPLVRLEIDTPRWRVAEDGLPFTGMGMAWLFGPKPLTPGRETSDPEDIPTLVGELLEFVGTSDLSPEVVAAHMPHLVGHVHPFVDGNGHTSRMLLCDLLSRSGYGVPTLVAYVDCFAALRSDWSTLMQASCLGRARADELVCSQLRLVLNAQDTAREAFG